MSFACLYNFVECFCHADIDIFIYMGFQLKEYLVDFGMRLEKFKVDFEIYKYEAPRTAPRARQRNGLSLRAVFNICETCFLIFLSEWNMKPSILELENLLNMKPKKCPHGK